MSTAIAISSAALAMGAANSARFEQQKTQACLLYVEGFDSRVANVAEQKHYAECIQRLNPEPISGTESLLLKGCVISLIISMIVGAIVGKKNRSNDWFDVMMYTLAAPFILGIVFVVLWMVFAGVMFVMS